MRIEAKTLRDKKELAKVSAGPGCYKWWAHEAEFRQLLDALCVDYDSVADAVEKKDGLYCIYVGDAINESLRQRMNWHINQKHSLSNVKSGHLSTLRQTISSLVAHNQMVKKETDDFIDKLEVELFEVDAKVHSDEASTIITPKEKAMINSHLRILNIKDNKRDDAREIRKRLMQLRAEAKVKALG